ncbi:MAG: tRNA 4-thiouridine(8) synthase ThiI [Firmicutes bacterium]|nr:tRNA 4-thiouridine(8) synthase ThiI [Bacillota bacterium]
MDAILLIRYGEIALKGKNRPFFEKKLEQNIKTALRGLEPFKLIFQRGRFFLHIGGERLFSAQERLRRVFGIVSVSPAYPAEPELAAICQEALALLRNSYFPGVSFKIETNRVNKRFPYPSPEVNSQVGAFILKSGLDVKVDVHQPQILIQIEIRERVAYLFCERYPGPGGLPVGVTGRGLLLLSGGIDSPVAGYMALKRGVTLEALHFYSPPFTGEAAVNKVNDLCRVLASYGEKIKLHLAHFTEIQTQIRLHCPESMTITLMRRAMFRIAEKLAARRGIEVLFTGESLGQVASQTLENLTGIDRVVSIPVLRPLIGFDKEEIVNISRQINTYSISTLPFEDCCTLFVPKHPVTRPKPEELEKAEKKIPLDELLASCLEKIETRTVNP